ncbi:hypothetical protein BDV98DRAFT_599441 [Pterulicium gracile]|uniref:Uncharacterized protein n=1 Tax=Pterulicium gracile TaxID=1884261 RepID=A0A5C3R334_9AGAR|nr:hypothetical protein BDV98DRAFT_599441 [Pterula gracilis]
MLTRNLLRSPFVLQPVFLSRGYAASKHSSETYNKDADTTPPPDSKIFRVDASSDAAHKPHEPAPTERTAPTETSSKEVPYTPKGEHGESQDKRYGATGSYEPSDSHQGGGPESSNAGGRKPEKR